MVDAALESMSGRFDDMYSKAGGRRSRQSGSSGRCCCRLCTRSAASEC